MSKREIIICRDIDELNRMAAAQFVALAEEAIARSGRFAVALSGGSTPKALYSLLASNEYRDRIDWPRVQFFWGDERCVPPDHAENNYRMAQEALLSKVRIPSENIHRMMGELEPARAAEAYEEELRTFFALAPGARPRFDLILLGLGEDGHTASLFPEGSAVNDTTHLVVADYLAKLRAHRLTVTLLVINNSAQATFLVAGDSKAGIVKDILALNSNGSSYPAARVNLAEGRLTWLIAADAAVLLPPQIADKKLGNQFGDP